MLKIVSNGYFRGIDGKVHSSLNILNEDAVIGFYNTETDEVVWSNNGKAEFLDLLHSNQGKLSFVSEALN